MRILITGIDGFIGSHLLKSLGNRHDIFGISRTPVVSSMLKNLTLNLNSSDFTHSLPPNVDCVIHLAQSNQYRVFPTGAIDMNSINITSTLRLIDWAVEKSIKKFIFFSTGNVYGSSPGLRIETDTFKPESFYAATKCAAELLLAQYRQFISLHILRLYSVYGPKQKNRLIPNLTNQIRNNLPIYLNQGIGLRTTPIYIDDVTEIIQRILLLNKQDLTLNICGNEILTLKDIASKIGQELKVKPHFYEKSALAAELCGSNELLQGTIKNYNFLSFEEGLQRLGINSK